MRAASPPSIVIALTNARRSRFAATLVRDFRAIAVAALLAAAGCVSTPTEPWPATPAELYGELFVAVQTERVFPDDKTFVDAVPKRDPRDIVASYRRERAGPGFDLSAFVAREFAVAAPDESGFRTRPGEDVRAHIDRLWPVLTRGPDRAVKYSSRLPLPNRYVVPGGRFDEMYYWDSYFTMLGLHASGERALLRQMCDNFAFLIERYGHIPNGTRSYYLARSQPPFFALMVELLAAEEGRGAYARYRAALQQEYDFWMEGGERLGVGQAHRRVVRLARDALLNRYWDDRATPREESYREDLATASASPRPNEEVYRNLRAAAESGWDFSSRWFADGKTLASIRTVELVPVDLNSVLYRLEQTLASAYDADSPARAEEFRARAAARRAAVQRYLWNPEAGAFTDYLWREGRPAAQLTAAAIAPLFFGLASEQQAEAVGSAVRAQLLKAHGLVTTANSSGEQWDAPNGWAPLQWMAIAGFERYGNDELAYTIAQRWVKQNLAVFHATGKLVEKYDVTAADTSAAGGGEYPLQDGFGWTNGVLRALLVRYPELAAGSRVSGGARRSQGRPCASASAVCPRTRPPRRRRRARPR
jgi:alpha,alpha-trehalase